MDMMALSTIAMKIPERNAGRSSSAAVGRIASWSPPSCSAPNTARPNTPTSTAPESARSVQVIAVIIPGRTCCSFFIDRNRTKTCGEPQKPIPIAPSPSTVNTVPRSHAPLEGPASPGPWSASRWGSMERRVSETAPIPPAWARMTIGSETSPRNMSEPWKTSDHTTAVNPPWVMYRRTTAKPIAAPRRWSIPRNELKASPVAKIWAPA